MPSWLQQRHEGFDGRYGVNTNSAMSKVDGISEDALHGPGKGPDVFHAGRQESYPPRGRKRPRESEEKHYENPVVYEDTKALHDDNSSDDLIGRSKPRADKTGDVTRVRKRVRLDEVDKRCESEVQKPDWYVINTA